MTVLNINCSTKSSCIPCYVVGKYDRPGSEIEQNPHLSQQFPPHACFPRARLSHQQNLFSIHDVSGIGSPTISNDFSAMRGLDYFKESSNKADSNGICWWHFYQIQEEWCGRLKVFWREPHQSQRCFNIFNFSGTWLLRLVITPSFHFSSPVGSAIFLFSNVVPVVSQWVRRVI